MLTLKVVCADHIFLTSCTVCLLCTFQLYHLHFSCLTSYLFFSRNSSASLFYSAYVRACVCVCMCDVVWQAFGRLQRAWRGVVDLMQVHRALFWQTPLHFTSPFQREREGGGVYESQESIRGLVYCLRTHTHTHTHTHTQI